MGDLLVVQSKVKEVAQKVLKGKTFFVASDFADALSVEVEALIKKAAKRADDNGRKTIGPRDL